MDRHPQQQQGAGSPEQARDDARTQGRVGTGRRGQQAVFQSGYHWCGAVFFKGLDNATKLHKGQMFRTFCLLYHSKGLLNCLPGGMKAVSVDCDFD
jgi:hypothetical protein